MDCKVKRTNRNPNDYEVTLRGMTRGTIMSLKNSLEAHAAAGSACAGDVLAFFIAGIRSSGDDELVRSVLDVSALAASMPSDVPPPPKTSSYPPAG